MTVPIRLVATPGGTADVIEVDGHNIAHACRAYTLDAAVDRLPQLTLDLLLHVGGEVDGDAEVFVPAATHAALVALGWTPPTT